MKLRAIFNIIQLHARFIYFRLHVAVEIGESTLSLMYLFYMSICQSNYKIKREIIRKPAKYIKPQQPSTSNYS